MERSDSDTAPSPTSSSSSPRAVRTIRNTSPPRPPASVAAAVPSTVQKNKMWKTKQSIEDLENTLTKRWGTDLSHWTAQDIEDYEDDDHNYSNKEDSETLFRAKPVLDPWAKEKAKQSSDTEEDFTPIFGANRQAVKTPLSVGHLIASKPAGGRGTNQIDSSTAQDNDSFFFQAPRSVPEQPKQQTKQTKNDSKRTKETKNNISNTNDNDKLTEKKPIKPQFQSLLDENGNAMFLTTEQAMRNFEKIADQNELFDASVNDEQTDGVDDLSWQDLGITDAQLLRNLNAMNCLKPLSVQSKSIPAVMSNKDVLVGTYTGSGKTLSFLTPIVNRLLSDKDAGSSGNELQAIVIAPGRELASQIHSVARDLVKDTDLSVMMAIGGTTFSRNLEQIRKRKPNILIGTPGRLAELIVGLSGEKGGRLKTAGLETVVLDEFDALLEYTPHREPTHAIMESLQRRHGNYLQTILCSATASDLVDSPKLERFLKDDFYTANTDEGDILVTGQKEGAGKTVTRVSRTVIHGVVHVPHRRLALDVLRRILYTEPTPQQILVFVENSRKVDIVVEKLEGMGIIAAPLHGGRGNEKADRAEVSKALREGYVGLVVATELAARGIDAPLLTHVINMDLPTDASHYSHRAGMYTHDIYGTSRLQSHWNCLLTLFSSLVGRVGRGGRSGVVINLTTEPKERNVPYKFADQLGIDMYRVDVSKSKLNIIASDSPVE